MAMNAMMKVTVTMTMMRALETTMMERTAMMNLTTKKIVTMTMMSAMRVMTMTAHFNRLRLYQFPPHIRQAAARPPRLPH